MIVLEKRNRLIPWLQGDGIEIGALHRPLPVPHGARVRYVDRLPQDELRRHYPELDGQTLAPVTILGDAEHLDAIETSSLDFVIGNHLLEHLEDPIRALTEFHRVLKPDGILYLALPDPRVSFDRDRPLTSLEHLLDEHRHGTAGNRPAHYLEWARLVDKDPKPEERATHLMAINYSIHFHVWRPDTFLEFFYAARAEAGLGFQLCAFAPPEHAQDDEFIVVFARGSGNTLRLPPPGLRSTVGAAAPPTDGLKARIAASALGPWLRPGYRLVRRLSRGVKRPPRAGSKGSETPSPALPARGRETEAETKGSETPSPTLPARGRETEATQGSETPSPTLPARGRETEATQGSETPSPALPARGRETEAESQGSETPSPALPARGRETEAESKGSETPSPALPARGRETEAETKGSETPSPALPARGREQDE